MRVLGRQYISVFVVAPVIVLVISVYKLLSQTVPGELAFNTNGTAAAELKVIKSTKRTSGTIWDLLNDRICLMLYREIKYKSETIRFDYL